RRPVGGTSGRPWQDSKGGTRLGGHSVAGRPICVKRAAELHRSCISGKHMLSSSPRPKGTMGAMQINRSLQWLGTILAAVFVFAFASRFASATEQPPRPDIVLIIPDQLRAQALGRMGNSDVKTPHIDRMASEGVLFRQTFANTPVCCPARAIMLTGK